MYTCVCSGKTEWPRKKFLLFSYVRRPCTRGEKKASWLLGISAILSVVYSVRGYTCVRRDECERSEFLPLPNENTQTNAFFAIRARTHTHTRIYPAKSARGGGKNVRKRNARLCAHTHTKTRSKRTRAHCGTRIFVDARTQTNVGDVQVVPSAAFASFTVFSFGRLVVSFLHCCQVIVRLQRLGCGG